MHLFCIYLAFVARLHMAITIEFHYQPIVTHPQDLYGRRMPTRISPKGAFMDFCYDSVFSMSIHAPEQDRVIIPFIEHVPTQEEFG